MRARATADLRDWPGRAPAGAPDLLAPPSPAQFAAFPSGSRFLITVDTEEEFDWSSPLDRDRHSLSALPALRTFQAFCERHRVAPVYMIDYPVAASAEAAEVLGPAVAAGRAELGLQLHPWVTPPFVEEVNQYNSFAGNLPAQVEQAKLAALITEVRAHYGCTPGIYRAGRYGVGPRTAAMLIEAGVTIDSSVRCLFDYHAGGGPDFSRHPARPYWVDPQGRLLELPLTTVWCGAGRRLGQGVSRAVHARSGPARAMLARTHLLERVPLTPEGTTLAEGLRGIDAALAQRLPLLVFSFHSPSLVPGHTPYVRDRADVARLYAWWEGVLAHLAKRGVQPTSVREIIASVALA